MLPPLLLLVRVSLSRPSFSFAARSEKVVCRVPQNHRGSLVCVCVGAYSETVQVISFLRSQDQGMVHVSWAIVIALSLSLTRTFSVERLLSLRKASLGEHLELLAEGALSRLPRPQKQDLCQGRVGSTSINPGRDINNYRMASERTARLQAQPQRNTTISAASCLGRQ